MTPPPPGDLDDDGYTDDVDRCPSLGDEGYGLDEWGCPKFADGTSPYEHLRP